MSNRGSWIRNALVGAVGIALASPAGAGGARKVATAVLDGWQNVPAAIFTTGAGRVSLRKRDDRIFYVLRYANLEGDVTASAGVHIHFGRPGQNGGVLAFLCEGGGGAPAGTPSCPDDGTGSGVVAGNILDADVLPVPDQNFPGGSIDELWEVIKARAAYVNLHTTAYPPGEIRGGLR